MSRRSRVPRWTSLARVSVLIAIAVTFAMPLVWMLATSAQTEDLAMSPGLALLPDPPTSLPGQAHDNYKSVLTDETVNFPLFFRNTLIVVLLGVSGAMISSTIAAYGLARVRIPGRRLILLLTIATMLIPFPVLMAPLFMLYAKIDWIGTFLPLYAQFWFGNAFSIFLMHQFFRALPPELEEAARLDGCSTWRTFTHIALPLSKTALAVVGLLHFTYMWNDFLAPLVFIVDRDMFTVALGLQLYQSRAGQTPWTLLMAASVLTILPVFLVFVLANQLFTRGSISGGVKG